MRVDFSGWYSRPGLVARRYTYSNMGETKDFELEVHFEVQAGLAIYTFPILLISALDLEKESLLRALIEPMDGSCAATVIDMRGTPDNGGAVMGLIAPTDGSKCLNAFLLGRDLRLDVEMLSGEKLIMVPLPNDQSFERVYRAVYDQVRTSDDDEFKGSDGLEGRLSRFIRGFSSR